MKLICRLVLALERLASCVDPERGAIRMVDIDRAKVYSQHLGEKLRNDNAHPSPPMPDSGLKVPVTDGCSRSERP